MSQTIESRIDQIAKENCGDYPNIENCAPLEQLYAIESTMIGTEIANVDCHEFIKHLIKRLGITTDEAYEEWHKLLKPKQHITKGD